MSKHQLKNYPAEQSLHLLLSKVGAGINPVIKNASCIFSYTWNYVTNEGSAKLSSIDSCGVNDIPLYPIGLQGLIAFMSDMTPAEYVINGQQVFIYRIYLTIDPTDHSASAAIMFNKDGSCIEQTENFSELNNLNF